MGPANGSFSVSANFTSAVSAHVYGGYQLAEEQKVLTGKEGALTRQTRKLQELIRRKAHKERMQKEAPSSSPLKMAHTSEGVGREALEHLLDRQSLLTLEFHTAEADMRRARHRALERTADRESLRHLMLHTAVADAERVWRKERDTLSAIASRTGGIACSCASHGRTASTNVGSFVSPQDIKEPASKMMARACTLSASSHPSLFHPQSDPCLKSAHATSSKPPSCQSSCEANEMNKTAESVRSKGLLAIDPYPLPEQDHKAECDRLPRAVAAFRKQDIKSPEHEESSEQETSPQNNFPQETASTNAETWVNVVVENRVLKEDLENLSDCSGDDWEMVDSKEDGTG